MGLAESLNTSVTGLTAQSDATSVISNNIANANTIGYKQVESTFYSLVTDTGAASGYSSGGVNMRPENLIDQQGLIESTGQATDLAISGNGFFPVTNPSGALYFTRSGSFTVNDSGQLVNSNGYTLQGWALDPNGDLPGQGTNPNTTSADSLSSLSAVSTAAVSGTATATTTVSLIMNLNAGQSTFQGATATLAPQSTANVTNGENDIIVPAAGMEQGDAIQFVSNSLKSTFTYGGFAKSYQVANGIMGSSTTGGIFNSGVSNGNEFQITTAASGTSTFTYEATSPSTASGQFNSLSTLATAIDSVTGLTARVSNGVLYVSAANGNDAITFTDVSNSGLTANLGFSNVLASASGVNRFNTLAGLSTEVNGQAQIASKVINPTASSTLQIYGADPTQTLIVNKIQNTVTAQPLSAENGDNSSTGLIVPVQGTAMATGQAFSLIDGAGHTVTATYGGFATSLDIDTANSGAGIYGATTPTTAFTPSGSAPLLANGDTLTVNDGTSTYTFRFETSPTNDYDFNSLSTLAAAMNNATDNVLPGGASGSSGKLSAKIENGKLYVGAIAQNIGLTFSGSGGSTLAAQIGLTTFAAPGATVFNSLAQLNTVLSVGSHFSGVINNSSANSSLTITNATSADPISISTASSTDDDLVAELGLANDSQVGVGFFSEFNLASVVPAASSSGVIPESYDPTNNQENMAGGKVEAQFTRNVSVYDALGDAHTMQVGFLKIGTNKWAAEVYSVNQSDVSGANDGQVAAGDITFKGDGTLSSLDSGLLDPVPISWTTGATPSDVTFQWGSAGTTSGLSQFDAAYNVDSVTQNGVAAGQFNGVTIDSNGFVIANFSNGETRDIYRLPIAVFQAPDSLQPISGSVFATTQTSGEANLKQSGSGGAGQIISGSLEGSTTDVSTQLTNLISVQAIYNGDATSISVIRSMLDELTKQLGG